MLENYMSQPECAWVVRDKVIDEVKSRIIDISTTLLDEGIDESNFSAVVGVLQETLDISDWTGDEVDYALWIIRVITAIVFVNKSSSKESFYLDEDNEIASTVDGINEILGYAS